MKTPVKFLFVLLALCMQATTVFADGDGTPIYLFTPPSNPPIGGNAGPKRAPVRPRPLYIDVFLSEDNSCLNLYDTEGSTITYYIYSEDDEEVATGTISFVGQEEATISLQSLEPGIYYLDIVLDGVTYEGEFGIEE